MIDDFIGRTKELNTLEGMFILSGAPSDIPPRLLTLTGVGGSGKTRLARRFSDRIRGEFADGVIWIDLAPLTDSELVLRAVLTALDVPEQPTQPPVETLVAELAPKQLLLILDNCEHLLDGVRVLGQSLLPHCPELTILATSRESLGIRGEIVYPVLPLSLPRGEQAQDILDADAVKLFLVRAGEILPGFALTKHNRDAVVQVCTALDGLPLAIELAAARVKMMTVSEIADRLQDAFGLLTRSAVPNVPRHQTLRAAMDWSYELLSVQERALLQRTSIFSGGFTLEAAEQVCGQQENEPRLQEQPIPRREILDLLSDLANKSLVLIAERSEGSPTRYTMLEPVRQYARIKLQETGQETTLSTRHLEWCIALAERAETELAGAEQGHWLVREDSELANFRVALRRASENNTTAQGLRLANALWRYWDRRGKYSEAQGWYSQLLTGDLTQTPPRVRGKAMYRLAMTHYRLSQFDQAIRVCEASLVVARELDDRRGMGSILNMLGVVATDMGSFDRAYEFYTQALALYRELGDAQNIPRVLNNFGNLARQRGQYRHALEYYEQSLALKRHAGDAAEAALTLNDMSALFLELGEYAHGQAMVQECLAIYRGLGEKRGMYLTLTNMARARLYLEDYATAHTMLQEAEQIGTESESKGDLAYGLVTRGELAQAQGEYTNARSLFEQALSSSREASEHVSLAKIRYLLATNALALGQLNAAEEFAAAGLKRSQTQDHRPGMATGLEVMAGVAAAQTGYLRAAQFLGAAARLRERAETPAHPHERAEIQKIILASRTALGEREWNAALQRGRAAPIAETVAAALASSAQRTPGSVAGLAQAPQLHVSGLGQSVTLREGKPLTNADWTYAKSKELFFYLLSVHNASRQEIGVDLWADASPAQLRSIFHRVLGTLRKALGKNEWITFENEKYALNPALPYSYDVDLFEQHLTEAQRLVRAGAGVRSQTIAALQQAVALYHGDFLPDVQGGDWILFRREELRQKFLQALLRLGQLLLEQNDFVGAEAVYEQALTHDNFLEIAHRELMRARARRGEVGLALKQYQTLIELLRLEFGAQPAPETRAVYDRLRRGESV